VKDIQSRVAGRMITKRRWCGSSRRRRWASNSWKWLIKRRHQLASGLQRYLECQRYQAHLRVAGSRSIISGRDVQGRELKLIAGDLRRVEANTGRHEISRDARGMSAAAPGFEEKAFLKYTSTRWGGPRTVAQNQTKQIELAQGRRMCPVGRKFFFMTARHSIGSTAD